MNQTWNCWALSGMIMLHKSGMSGIYESKEEVEKDIRNPNLKPVKVRVIVQEVPE